MEYLCEEVIIEEKKKMQIRKDLLGKNILINFLFAPSVLEKLMSAELRRI
jgi:hypothetical protein